MNRTLQRILIWVLISLGTFILFFWLFNLAMPEAAFAFAFGITLIITSGLLTGNYVTKLWTYNGLKKVNKVLLVLIVLILFVFLLIGFLVNQMIKETQFKDFLFTVISLFLLSSFIAAIISLVRKKIKARIQTAQSQLVQSKAELHFLQSQISPHFLFNTLNNLYGLSLTEHQKVPVLLLKLSELLRYSLYEAKELFVSLVNEVQYLQNYIEFERIRLGNRLQLRHSFPERINKTVKIAPMLLIVFIENAFKHSRNSSEEKIYIKIKLEIQENFILFSIVNSYSPKENNSGPKNLNAGIGLESVRKRLYLLYKNKYDLNIAEGEREYSVTLKLKHNEIEKLNS